MKGSAAATGCDPVTPCLFIGAFPIQLDRAHLAIYGRECGMGEQKRRKLAGHAAPGATQSRRGKGRMRITWRAVVLFLGAMLILDILLYAIFRFGFGACYGVLCLLE